MKATEAIQTAAAERVKSDLASLELQARGLREELESAKDERGQFGARLEQASRELEASKEENANRAANEQVRH